MSHTRLFFMQAAVLAATAFVHIVALELSLYWYFPILNRIVHLAGGVWVAFAISWLFAIAGRRAALSVLIGAALCIGIGWEFFEAAIGMVGRYGYALDTALDLAMDVLGGFSGYFILRRARARGTISSHGSQGHSS